jgi:ubiquinone/menaquinone biosynthesis C-methylase UbiE
VTTDGDRIKQCCARLYESEFVSRVLGESFHPGGEALTERLGELLGLTRASHVIDAASGIGTSALLLAQRFGCSVVGIDFSEANVAHARAEAERLILADRVEFRTGDAEHLPLDDQSVDVVICECAFCTFPDKSQAAREFARVLTPGGRLGLSDITRAPGPPGELDDLMAWVACLADARPAAAYAELLMEAGFVDVAVERHDDALSDLVRRLGMKWLAAEAWSGLHDTKLAGFDLSAAKRLTKQAWVAIQQQRLGYVIVTARAPDVGTRPPA